MRELDEQRALVRRVSDADPPRMRTESRSAEVRVTLNPLDALHGARAQESHDPRPIEWRAIRELQRERLGRSVLGSRAICRSPKASWGHSVTAAKRVVESPDARESAR